MTKTKLRLAILSICLLLSVVFVGTNAGQKAHAAESEIEHDYLEITVAPTCTARGYTTHFCTVCGFEYVDNYTDALGHDYHEEVIAPICTTDGYTLFTCMADGYSYKDNYVYTFGHTYIPDVLAATCTDGGHTTYTCSDCSDSYIANYTQPRGHNHKEYVTLPTCVAYGYTEHICLDCGDKYVTDYVRPHGHDYIKTVIKPTESSTGYTINTCRDCNYSYLSDFVTSGDIDFEEHIHNYSLFVARYDSQEYFVLQNYCDCGETDNSLINIIFINNGGNYVMVGTDGNGKADYSALSSGNYNVFILNSKGEMLSTFKIEIPEEVIPEEHFHDFVLSITRCDDEKRFIVQYVCKCDEIQTAVFRATFIDDNGNSITLSADERGNIDYSQLVGKYNVFILSNQGEMLSNFRLEVVAEHIHNYLLSITRNDDEKYFIVENLCECGEVEQAVFHVIFIDENGSSTTLNADENGKVDYLQLAGNYDVFILSNYGEMLSGFKLSIAEEEMHTHKYLISVTKYDDEKFFIVQCLCDCGEVENGTFFVTFIDESGNYITLNTSENGKLDYSQLIGNYNVFIQNSQGEMLSFRLFIPKEHIHVYTLSVARYDDEKYFTAQYVCDCGEVISAVFHAVFIDESGDSITINADSNGEVHYLQLVGNYNVFALSNYGEILSNFTLSVAEEIIHIHSYSLSIERHDNERYFTVKYVCECGESENIACYAVFTDENGKYTKISSNENGEVRYFQLYEKHNVVIISSQGDILSSFTFSIGIEEETEHIHNYALTVARYDDENCFVLECICDCGQKGNSLLQVLFIDENGEYTLEVSKNGEVGYSHLEGDFTVVISDNEGNVLSIFELSVYDELNEPPVEDDSAGQPKNSVLPVVLVIVLVLLAAGGITAFFLYKKKNKNKNK